MTLSRQALGRAAEAAAAVFLQEAGFELLARNYRRRLGELDLVARREDLLLVVEVRTRSSMAFGGAAASIDARKRAHIVRTTRLLLREHAALARLRVRFDVIVVSELDAALPRIEWIRHAFSAT